MTPPQLDDRRVWCAGQKSPVRPASMVPVCRTCARLDRLELQRPHQVPAARHDGKRWQCDEKVPATGPQMAGRDVLERAA